MNKSIALFIVFYSLISSGYSQDSLQRKNAIYLEIGGAAGYGSINYERQVFNENKFKINGRIGLSTLKIYDFQHKINPQLLVPVSIQFQYGHVHNIEFGFGMTYSNNVYASDNFTPERSSSYHGNAGLYYRFEGKKGFLLRCGYTPIIENFKRIRHWGGVSIGYRF